jgi:tellurite resistance protein TehA-like permease
LLDERLGASLFIWAAALALLASAYVNLKEADFGGDPWAKDPYPRIMFFCAFGVSLILAWLAATRFFGKNKFEMSYWGYTFPLATMAVVTLQYHKSINTHLTEVG